MQNRPQEQKEFFQKIVAEYVGQEIQTMLPRPLWNIIGEYFTISFDLALRCPISNKLLLDPIFINHPNVEQLFYDRIAAKKAIAEGKFSPAGIDPSDDCISYDDSNVIEKITRFFSNPELDRYFPADRKDTTDDNREIFDELLSHYHINIVTAIRNESEEAKRNDHDFIDLFEVFKKFNGYPIARGPNYLTDKEAKDDLKKIMLLEGIFLALLSYGKALYMSFKDGSAWQFKYNSLWDFPKDKDFAISLTKFILKTHTMIHHFTNFFLGINYLRDKEKRLSTLGLSSNQNFTNRITRIGFMLLAISKEIFTNHHWFWVPLNLAFEVVPNLVLTDIICNSDKKNQSFAEKLIILSSLISAGIMRYKSFSQHGPTLGWSYRLAQTLLFLPLYLPTMILGATQLVSDIKQVNNDAGRFLNSNCNSTGFFQPRTYNLYRNINRLIITLMFATLSKKKNTPCWAVAASLIYYLVSASTSIESYQPTKFKIMSHDRKDDDEKSYLAKPKQ